MAQSPFFSASCLASNGTRSNGTVPLNQNLIQVDGVLSPCRAGCYGRTPECAELPAAAAHSDHPIVENSQRWSREAIAIVSASCAHPLAGVCAGSCRPPLLQRRTHHDEIGVFIFSSLASRTRRHFLGWSGFARRGFVR
ncbi:MAG TPA: hypothetical protein VEN30_29215 [Paraburkholderia sp.]|nr:hypothetical protein [Paraburkholderia sp.]